jgi:glutathionylspermidine synthase
VLERDEHHALCRGTEALASAFVWAGRKLQRDVPLLVDLGFPWAVAELLAAEEPRTPLVGRFDCLQDRDGRWWFLEYNADTPSGLREAAVGDPTVRELLPEARDLCLPNARFCAKLADAFVGAAASPRMDAVTPALLSRPHAPLAPPLPLALLTHADELEDLCQTAFLAELLRPALADHGIDVILGDARNLRASLRNLSLLGRPVGALYRLLSFESSFGSPTFAALAEAAVRGRVTLLNGLFGLLLQHKGLMAWLWAHRDDPELAPEQRAAIRDHLPPTWPIDAVPADEPRAGLVAKQVFGREGEEVHLGADLAVPAWDELRRRRTYVAQRRIDWAPLAAAVPTSAGAVLWRGAPTVGPFAVDGAWAGYYTRFGESVVTARAKWIATLVE